MISIAGNYQHLASSQEEADTKINLHAVDAYRQGATKIDIHLADTDVFILCLGHFDQYQRIHSCHRKWSEETENKIRSCMRSTWRSKN